jgi:hypothetical protein
MEIEIDPTDRHLLVVVLAVAANARPWLGTFSKRMARKIEAEKMYEDLKAASPDIAGKWPFEDCKAPPR